MRGYPGWFYPVFLLTMAIVIMTGCLLTPTMLDLRLEWDMPWKLGANQRTGVAAMHATASFLMLMLLGSLWSIHMRAGWRHRQNWRSGLGLVVLMTLLMVSAIGLYYLGDELGVMVSAISHLGTGVLMFFLFGYHAARSHRCEIHHYGAHHLKKIVGHQRK